LASKERGVKCYGGQPKQETPKDALTRIANVCGDGVVHLIKERLNGTIDSATTDEIYTALDSIQWAQEGAGVRSLAKTAQLGCNSD
jgi:hypothetical protein